MRRGLATSGERARADIAAGRVLVSGAVAAKPAHQVAPDQPIELLGPPPRYVGRGGVKMEAALDHFGVDPAGRRCIDVGASTGGFTDCLLQRGAASVVALDVGRGQLHERLRADPRVENRERTNARDVTPEGVGGPADLVVADLSFISLAVVASPLVGLVAPGGDLVALVKPQFEAGRAEVSPGRGVIRDPMVWRRVLAEVEAALTAEPATMMGAMVSPITGAEGNVEFLVHLVRDPLVRDPLVRDQVATPPDLDAVVAAAVASHDGN